MSEQKVPRRVEQRIVTKFLVGENVPSAEIHHRLRQQYGEESLLRSGVSASERADSAWRMNRMIVGRHPDCSGVDTPPPISLF
jgi:hypothetical protein